MPHWRNIGRVRPKQEKEPGVFSVGDRVYLPFGNACCINDASHGEVTEVHANFVIVHTDNGEEEDCSLRYVEHESI